MEIAGVAAPSGAAMAGTVTAPGACGSAPAIGEATLSFPLSAVSLPCACAANAGVENGARVTSAAQRKEDAKSTARMKKPLSNVSSINNRLKGQ